MNKVNRLQYKSLYNFVFLNRESKQSEPTHRNTTQNNWDNRWCISESVRTNDKVSVL